MQRKRFLNHWNQQKVEYTIASQASTVWSIALHRRTCEIRAGVPSSCHLYSGGLVDSHCIWASASNNKRVEHCWKMGRTRRHLPMYRTRMYEVRHVAVCVREMQTVCIIPCHPILRELSELWHVTERMNACRNRHSFQLRMGEEDARIIGRLCLYKCVCVYI